jgi:hypothetical protein
MAGREAEQQVRVPMIRQDWRDVTFVHWSYPGEVVQALLPEDLVVDTFDGLAWVSLTPFRVDRLRGPIGPPIPGVAQFAETNLRTYVVAADGRDGLFFFDIEASHTAVARLTRTVFGLPYRVARMGVSTDGHPRYIGNRTAANGDVGYDIRVDVGSRLPAPTRDELEDWLAGRWRAFGAMFGRRISIEVEHPTWDLYEAALLRCEEDLLRSAGLPQPTSPAIVRWSPGVPVALSFPRRVRRR